MAITAAQLFAIVSVKGAGGAVSALKGVSGAVNSTQASLGKIETGTGQLALGLTRIGIAGGIAAAGGLAVAAKTSVDFADAFAGVRKTVDGSPAELSALYKQLENLSTRIPVSFADIAGIAQEAGALGVPTAAVSKFAEAVSRTTAATVGLDTATASEAFGKLGTIFDLNRTTDGYERLGSALIELGNTQASTEPDILEITRRFAASGQAAGLSEAQTLGWASAIGSLGQLPQAAGSSLQRFFQIAFQNAAAGGAKFKLMAKVAGESAASFKQSMGTDASGALEDFLKGLGRLDKFGQQDVLKRLGLSSVRTSQGILLLSQHTDLLDSSLATANDAWQQNTALVDVSNKRFDTLKSKLTELRNTGLVALADLGAGITPALGRLADRFQGFVAGYEADFTRIGTEIGDAIDDIDWTEVEHGAETVYDWLQKGFDILRQVPPQVDLAVAAFLGLNKVSGGLLGAGVGNIASGVLGGLAGGLGRGVASKVPGLGRLVATPVYIVGAAPGVNLGGLGGAAGAGGGSKVLGAVRILGAVTLAAGSLYEVVQTLNGQNAQLKTQHDQNLSTIGRFLGSNPSDTAIRRAISGIEAQKNNPLNFAELNIGSFLGLTGLSDLNAEEAALRAALGSQHGAPAGEHSALSPSLVSAINSMQRLRGEHAGVTADEERANLGPVVKVLDQLHQDLIDARGDLAKATNPAAILAAAERIVQDTRSAGGVLTTEHVLAALKSKEQLVTDPKQRAEMDRLIDITAHRLDVRRQMDALVSKDTALLNSGHLTNSQLGGVNRDIATLRSHGDTHAASELVKLEQIRAKKLSATVVFTQTMNLRLDGRTVAHDVVKWTKGGVGLA